MHPYALLLSGSGILGYFYTDIVLYRWSQTICVSIQVRCGTVGIFTPSQSARRWTRTTLASTYYLMSRLVIPPVFIMRFAVFIPSHSGNEQLMDCRVLESPEDPVLSFSSFLLLQAFLLRPNLPALSVPSFIFLVPPLSMPLVVPPSSSRLIH